MATWAIGDVQGCHRTLERLLERVGPADDDVLVLVGDLVNRGARSLEVLRWALGQGDRLRAVLGNHDLHLLGVDAGVRRHKGKDTLEAVLEARDRGDLLGWLAARPLLLRLDVPGQGEHVVVHAGLLPEWSTTEAADLAAEVEAALRGRRRRTLEALFAGGGAPRWSPRLAGDARLRAIAAALTRLRTISADGAIEDDFSGPPEEAPPGCRPWFEVPGRRSAAATVVFGHWAALGLRLGPGVVACDSGCVWGRGLTAVRLEDRTVVQEPTARSDVP